MLRQKQRGFSLIELMIALVIGLVMTFAIVTFVAMLLSNSSRTVSSIRLSQELRALSEVISRDVRRARGVADAIGLVGTGCASPCGIQTLTVTPASSCILYAYSGAVGGDFRAVRRVETGGIGTLVLAAGNAAQTCAAAGTQLNSPLVDVTEFSVELVNQKQLDITIQGRLIGDSSGATQTYRTSVYVRSDSV